MISSLAERGFALMVDVTLKSFLLLGIAYLFAGLLRRSSASARHLLWTLTLGSLLALPFLVGALPRWQLPLPTLPALAPVPSAQSPVPLPLTSSPAKQMGKGASPSVDLRSSPSPPGSFGSFPSALPPSPFIPVLLFGIWLAGVAAFLTRWGSGMARLLRIRRHSLPIRGGELAEAVAAALRDLKVTRRVEVYTHRPEGHAPGPCTWGAKRPTVVLPEAAALWPEGRLRSILLHEIAHVRRGDWPVQVMAEFACAFYWFHPLAWKAARRLRSESERACDDLALSVGVSPPDYAGHLLEVLRLMKQSPSSYRNAISMASTDGFEGRFRAILDGRRNRTLLSPRAVRTALGLAVALLVPVAALRPARTIQASPGHPALQSSLSAKESVSSFIPTSLSPTLPTAPEQMIRPYSHVKGSANARVTFVEFDDPGCPSCAEEAEVVDQLLKLHPKDLRLVSRIFPLRSHAHSRLSAEALEAAAAQSPQKYWQLRTVLYRHLTAQTEADLYRYAKQIGLDVKRFKHDLAAHKYAAQVQQDRADGDALNVDRTPTLFLNGKQRYDGPLTLEDLDAKVKALMATKAEGVRDERKSATNPTSEPSLQAKAEPSRGPRDPSSSVLSLASHLPTEPQRVQTIKADLSDTQREFERRKAALAQQRAFYTKSMMAAKAYRQRAEKALMLNRPIPPSTRELQAELVRLQARLDRMERTQRSTKIEDLQDVVKHREIDLQTAETTFQAAQERYKAGITPQEELEAARVRREHSILDLQTAKRHWQEALQP